MRMLTRVIAIVAAVGFLGLARPVTAGIVVVDSSRSIDTSGPGIVQTNTASGTSPFNSTISKSGTFLSTTFQASASQNSTITATSSSLHISATGAASFSVNGTDLQPTSADNIEGSSSYSVTFQVTTPTAYTVVEQTDHQTQQNPGSDLEANSNGAELLMGTKELIPFPLFAISSSAPQTYTGTLAEGTYTFKGSASAFDISSSGSSSFSADLTVGSSSGTGSAAVPLPPAVWMALASLIAVLPATRLLTRRQVGCAR